MAQQDVIDQLTTQRQRNIFLGITRSETQYPYRLEGEKTLGGSGYSFGWVHWDMKQRPNGDEFKYILKPAVEAIGSDLWSEIADQLVASGRYTAEQVSKEAVLNRITTGLRGDKVVNAFLPLINIKLAQADYAAEIDTKTVAQITTYDQHLQTAINGIDGNLHPQYKAFAETNAVFHVALCDVENQQGEFWSQRLAELVANGSVTCTYDSKTYSFAINGELGLEDLATFLLGTKGGVGHPAIAMTRFSNILESLGQESVGLSAEDAEFFAKRLSDLLGKDFYKIVFDHSSGNEGLRDLVLRAWNERTPGLWVMIKTVLESPVGTALLGTVHDGFLSALAAVFVPPSDPLLVDLDGGGLETTSVANGPHFDHDGNGFAQRTGWASGDDGLLVRDRNGDAVINNGGELFGDQTLLRNGSKASGSFQALADLDDNLDGKIDSSDAAFSELRVWQDIDENGYSATDELLTLDELGITAINTGYTTVNVTDPNGNTQTQAGTFTWADETTGEAGGFQMRQDIVFTTDTESLDVPAEIKELPDAQGYGNTYDLHQAMVRDGSGQLQSLVEQFVAATDPAARASLMDQILFKWTGSDGINPTSRGPNIDARKLAVLEKMFAEPFVGVDGPNPNATASAQLKESYAGVYEMFYAQLMAQTHVNDLYDLISYSWDEVSQSLIGDLSAVKTELETRLAADPGADVVAGEFIRTVLGFGAEEMLDLDDLRSNQTFSYLIDSFGPTSQMQGSGGNDTLTGTANADGMRGGAGDDTISGGSGNDILLGQSGNDTLDGVDGADTLVGGAGNDTLGGAAGSTEFYGAGNTYEGGPGNDTSRGTISGDTYKFNVGDGQDTIQDWVSGYGNPSGTDILHFGAGIAPSDISKVERSGNDLVFYHVNGTDKVTVKDWYTNTNGYYRLERVEFADGTVWTESQVTAMGLVVNGTSGNDTMSGLNSYADTLNGLGGNDTLYGLAGNDTLNGGDGDDTLDGADGADVLNGGAGNDTLGGAPGSTEFYGAGNTYEGGPGNDTSRGTLSGDTYKFNVGDGQDTIQDWVSGYGNPSGTDILRFGAGIAPSDISKVERSGNDIVFYHVNGTDKVTVKNWFAESYGNYYRLEHVEFADGTVWTESQVTAMGLVVNGTSGNDTMSGLNSYADTLNGLGGNDTLYGLAGNDTLNGGDGDDTLDGTDGADVLNGGAGNDTLGGAPGSTEFYGAGNTYEGGPGNDTSRGTLSGDTYKFNVGDGQDTIQDWVSGYGNPSGTDILRFGTGSRPSDMTLSRSGNNMVFSHANGTDRVTVQNWFAASYPVYYRLERVEFADGSVFDLSDLQLGTTGNDTLNGASSDSVMMGSAGNDTLNGNAGNDLINGGAGNDTLNGGTGNDTYAFGRGYGQDSITDYDTTQGNSDKVNFGPSVNPLDLIFVNNGNNQDIQIYNAADLLTVQNQNAESASQVEAFVASDGSRLLAANVGLLIQAMADFSTQTGMSWSQGIQNDPATVQQILAQYWQPPT